MSKKIIAASILLILSSSALSQSETLPQNSAAQPVGAQVIALTDQVTETQPLDDASFQLLVENAQREARKRIRALLTAKRTPITSENCLSVMEKTIKSSPYQMFVQEGETISLVPIFSNWSSDMFLDEETAKTICPEKNGTLIATFLPEKFAIDNPREYVAAATLAERDQERIQRVR